jgi:predicted dienelactone hydrolase
MLSALPGGAILSIALLASVVSERPAASQDGAPIRELPRPTGALPVGVVTLHLSDHTRQEPHRLGGGVRELMIDVWYPAEPAEGLPHPYFDPRAFNDAASADRLRGLLRAAYDEIREGRVRTHARQRVPFSRSVRRAPLLIFSHGGGEARETYVAQLEDLASVIDELLKMNDARSSTLPFTGRLDGDRMGAFGHSAGGQAAAHACQIEPRLRACLNQDGLAAFAPYYLDSRGWGMTQSFMLIVRNTPREQPSPEELAAMHMTLEQAQQLLAKLDARQDACLRLTGGGAYRVLINAAKTTHADFGDLPFLQSTTPSEAEPRAQILESVRTSHSRVFSTRP